MTPEATKSTQRPAAEDFVPQTRIFAVTFTHAVQFGSSKDSLAVDKTSSNGCDSITPALMLGDGSWRGIEKGEHADGLGFKKAAHNLHTRAREVLTIFVPWARVACVQYRAAEQ